MSINRFCTDIPLILLSEQSIMILAAVFLLTSFQVQASRLTFVPQGQNYDLELHRSNPDFTFASYYGDHMVLQQSPRQAAIWGYASKTDVGQEVDLTLQSLELDYKKTFNTFVTNETVGGYLVWRVQLDAMKAGGPYQVTARIQSGATASLKDILFGDVWLCSGQSNMEFTVHQMFNGSAEINVSSSYKEVRLFQVGKETADIPLYDLKSVGLQWSLASADTVGHGDWSYFSAVCWMYGRLLYDALKYPIGLVETCWGGTPVEAWSSPVALKQCGVQSQDSVRESWVDSYTNQLGLVDGPDDNSALWNAMIHPLLNLTIYGAIWYQGESDSDSSVKMNRYNCTFPAMITDWRKNFQPMSDPVFPFGFVQLAPNRNTNTTVGFPDIRWHQTADMGYVPNFLLPNVFMAVAIDLPDFSSPYGSIHPRDKNTVGQRLALSGRAIAYKQEVKFQGPMVTAYFIDIGYYTLKVELDQGKTPIHVRSNDGFEVCCSHDNQTYCPNGDAKWVSAPIIASDSTSVTMSWDTCKNQWIVGLRYLWKESPCSYKMCPVYTVENELPMAPFTSVGLIGDERTILLRNGKRVFYKHISAEFYWKL